MAIDLLAVTHVNVNCSDLERSLAFYRDTVGLTPMSHTNPVPQDGSGFGLSGEVQWDAHLLHDHRNQDSPAIDLLQWMQPQPVGTPPAVPNHLGFGRVCVMVPDAHVTYASLMQAGVPVIAPPEQVSLTVDAAVTVFFALDPDGTMVEFVSGPFNPGAPQLLHVNIGCSNLERSSAWYQEVMGLQMVQRSAPGAVDGSMVGLDSQIEWNAELLAVAGQEQRFMIELMEWKTPKPVGSAKRQANELGLFRMAFLVADAKAGVEQLRAHGVDCPDAVWLDMGPDIPIDGLWAAFFPDPDGTCLELIGVPTPSGN